MSSYEKKLYEFITSPENFEFAHEIWENYGNITEKLKKEFWIEVKKYCEVEYSQTFSLNTNDDFVDGNDPELLYEKNNWNVFGIGFSNLMKEPFFGICLYDENLNKKTINRIIKYAEDDFLNSFDVEFSNSFTVEYDENDGYFVYKGTKDDFDNLSVLIKILPTKRGEMVKIYGNYLIEFAKKMEEKIDKWEKEIVKWKI